MWLQNLIAVGTVKLSAVSGNVNPADIGTKSLTAARLKSLMSLLGMYNMSTNVVEGSDDPGRISIKKQSVRALISALSLLQLPGCDVDFNEPQSSWMLVVFTRLLGLLM